METVSENMRRVRGGPGVDVGHGLKAWFYKDWSAGMIDGFAGASPKAIWYTGNRDDSFIIMDEDDDDSRQIVIQFYTKKGEMDFSMGGVHPTNALPIIRRLLCN